MLRLVLHPSWLSESRLLDLAGVRQQYLDNRVLHLTKVTTMTSPLAAYHREKAGNNGKRRNEGYADDLGDPCSKQV